MIVFLAALLMILGLIGRMVYLMVFDAEYYQKKAEDLHERERKIRQPEEKLSIRMVQCWQQTGRCVQFRSYIARLRNQRW